MDNTHIMDRMIFYAIVVACLFFILLSHPFMRIPFDIWEHLMRITSLYDTGTCFIFWPEDAITGLYFWHWIWAEVFRLLHISDVFTWAKVIHVTQFMLAAVAVYYFSLTIYGLLDDERHDLRNRYLALSATLLWFLGNGTISIYQQAWISWYSVSYQGMSIPLFWYMLALTVRLFHEETMSALRQAFITLQVGVISLLIIFMHPSEIVFYLLNVLILIAVCWKNTLHFFKNHFLFMIVAFICVIPLIIFIKRSGLLPIPSMLQGLPLGQLAAQIHEIGNWVVHGGGNRFPHAVSELAIFSLVCAVIFRFSLFFSKQGINTKLFDFIVLSSVLFFMIPLNGMLAGLAGVITHGEIVWRFIFGSMWFVILPYVSMRLMLRIKKKNVLATNCAATAFTIVAFFFLSRFVFYQAFYYNVCSVIKLSDERLVGLQYSQQDVRKLGQILAQVDTPVEGKTNMFYIRGDLAPLVRTVYRKYVYADRRNLFPRNSFFVKGLDMKYRLIDVDLPPDFPKDKEMFMNFRLDKKQI